jgi:hypothetical protein
VLLLPAMPDPFDTAELATAVGCNRRLAQQMAYCLRAMACWSPTVAAAAPFSTAQPSPRDPCPSTEAITQQRP